MWPWSGLSRCLDAPHHLLECRGSDGGMEREKPSWDSDLLHRCRPVRTLPILSAHVQGQGIWGHRGCLPGPVSVGPWWGVLTEEVIRCGYPNSGTQHVTEEVIRCGYPNSGTQHVTAWIVHCGWGEIQIAEPSMRQWKESKLSSWAAGPWENDWWLERECFPVKSAIFWF